MAHMRVWSAFLRMRSKTRLVVLEDDAEVAPGLSAAHFHAILGHLAADITYLGWCYEDAPPCHRPLCLHAYGLTTTGAAKLLQQIDSCAFPLDQQIACTASAGRVTLARAPDLLRSGTWRRASSELADGDERVFRGMFRQRARSAANRTTADSAVAAAAAAPARNAKRPRRI
mmetsp:Transcript_10341/g.27487  ORF Transcript_10341/g.27487 Transcript_10341/m.27487 type:complete len:172 (+) Transcript_10341:74-589(+)|eukprot:5851182-Prymnesium_polylepis.1